MLKTTPIPPARYLDVRRFVTAGTLDTEALGAFLRDQDFFDLNLYADDAASQARCAFATERKTGRRITFFLERR